MGYTIGDYYDRVERQRREAVAKLLEAVKKYEDEPTYSNYAAMREARKMVEMVEDAGNTGDWDGSSRGARLARLDFRPHVRSWERLEWFLGILRPLRGGMMKTLLKILTVIGALWLLHASWALLEFANRVLGRLF